MSNSIKQRQDEYRHRYLDGSLCGLPTGKAICVGRNYLDHIKELNSPLPEQSMFFMKPSTALCGFEKSITIPQKKGECHNELELTFLVKNKLTCANVSEVEMAIAGIGLSLDLTLRDEQSRLKQLSHPWERAKAFDGSCPTSKFVSWQTCCDDEYFVFELLINGQSVQQGDSRMMLKPAFELIAEMSHWFTLVPGDIVLTGTPKGVRALHAGDRLNISLQNYFIEESRVLEYE